MHLGFPTFSVPPDVRGGFGLRPFEEGDHLMCVRTLPNLYAYYVHLLLPPAT